MHYRQYRRLGLIEILNTRSRIWYYRIMSKTKILNQQPNLTKDEQVENCRVDDGPWCENGEQLSAEEKALLDSRLASYLDEPEAGSSWEEVETRIRARLTR